MIPSNPARCTIELISALYAEKSLIISPNDTICLSSNPLSTIFCPGICHSYPHEGFHFSLKTACVSASPKSTPIFFAATINLKASVPEISVPIAGLMLAVARVRSRGCLDCTSRGFCIET